MLSPYQPILTTYPNILTFLWARVNVEYWFTIMVYQLYQLYHLIFYNILTLIFNKNQTSGNSNTQPIKPQPWLIAWQRTGTTINASESHRHTNQRCLFILLVSYYEFNELLSEFLYGFDIKYMYMSSVWTFLRMINNIVHVYIGICTQYKMFVCLLLHPFAIFVIRNESDKYLLVIILGWYHLSGLSDLNRQ